VKNSSDEPRVYLGGLDIVDKCRRSCNAGISEHAWLGVVKQGEMTISGNDWVVGNTG